MDVTKLLASILFLFSSSIITFNVNSNNNLVLYWGQNSYGVKHGNNPNAQKPLKYYCEQPGVSLINISFMHIFDGKNSPLITLSSACGTTFPGSKLLNCPDVGADIKYCQSKGIAILMSLGGAEGAYGFASDADGKSFAHQIWDLLFKGKATNRPFGDAVLDGIDLDIEVGSPIGYAAFISELRTLYSSDPSKKYYIAGAPQCPFPDKYLGPSLNSAWFDMVFIQFYNNYCGLSGQFNYADWDKWVKITAVNKNVKLYVGLPGAQAGAGSGYVDASAISSKLVQVRSQFLNFGGLMLWDASQVYNNGNFGQSVANFLAQGGNGGVISAPIPTADYSSLANPNGTSIAPAPETYSTNGNPYSSYGGNTLSYMYTTSGNPIVTSSGDPIMTTTVANTAPGYGAYSTDWSPYKDEEMVPTFASATNIPLLTTTASSLTNTISPLTTPIPTPTPSYGTYLTTWGPYNNEGSNRNANMQGNIPAPISTTNPTLAIATTVVTPPIYVAPSIGQNPYARKRNNHY